MPGPLPFLLLSICHLGRGDRGRSPGGGYLPRRLLCTPRCGDLGRCPSRSRSLIVTPHHRVGKVLVDGRRWCRLDVRRVTDLVAALLLVSQWRRAPVDTLAMLHTRHDS
jgi:hypothetical protein